LGAAAAGWILVAVAVAVAAALGAGRGDPVVWPPAPACSIAGSEARLVIDPTAAPPAVVGVRITGLLMPACDGDRVEIRLRTGPGADDTVLATAEGVVPATGELEVSFLDPVEAEAVGAIGLARVSARE